MASMVPLSVLDLSPILEGSDAGRFLEFWNLVFMQYDRSADGKLTPLPKPSVDTGAGLERIAAIKQRFTSNYDTDLIRPIIEFTAKLAERSYEPESPEGFAIRVIADHARNDPEDALPARACYR